MIEWLRVVRVSDMESVRFALAAFANASRPVGLRRAQQWVVRMIDAGLIDRDRLTVQDGSVIWATQRTTGMRPLNILGQTFRHEVAVASASARYLFNGWTWSRDRKASSYHDHQADGLATRDGETELVEVELTPKSVDRYGPICNSHVWRMTKEGVSRVVYLCTADATRMVAREADKLLFRDNRPRLVTITAFGRRGSWIDKSGRFPEVWQSKVVETQADSFAVSLTIHGRSNNDQQLNPTDRLF